MSLGGLGGTEAERQSDRSLGLRQRRKLLSARILRRSDASSAGTVSDALDLVEGLLEFAVEGKSSKCAGSQVMGR